MRCPFRLIPKCMCGVRPMPPQRVRHRLDRAEVVLAPDVGQEAAVPLEVAVGRHVFADAASVPVRLVRVALPDLDERVAHRCTAGRGHRTVEVGDLPHRRRDAVVDDEQVVVGVERHHVGIEGPVEHPVARRHGQLVGEDARRPERDRAQRPGPQRPFHEDAPRQSVFQVRVNTRQELVQSGSGHGLLLHALRDAGRASRLPAAIIYYQTRSPPALFPTRGISRDAGMELDC